MYQPRVFVQKRIHLPLLIISAITQTMRQYIADTVPGRKLYTPKAPIPIQKTPQPKFFYAPVETGALVNPNHISIFPLSNNYIPPKTKKMICLARLPPVKCPVCWPVFQKHAVFTGKSPRRWGKLSGVPESFPRSRGRFPAFRKVSPEAGEVFRRSGKYPLRPGKLSGNKEGPAALKAGFARYNYKN